MLFKIADILEKNNLTESLSSHLEADREMGQRGCSSYQVADVNPAFAVRRADAKTGLADSGKDGVAVGICKIDLRLRGLFENGDRRGVIIGGGVIGVE